MFGLLAVMMRVVVELGVALPGCIFRSITSVPCPFCGTGHFFLALSQLDFRGAFFWQPGLALVMAACGGVLIMTLFSTSKSPNFTRLIAALPARRCFILLAASMVLNWTYLILTLR